MPKRIPRIRKQVRRNKDRFGNPYPSPLPREDLPYGVDGPKRSPADDPLNMRCHNQHCWAIAEDNQYHLCQFHCDIAVRQLRERAPNDRGPNLRPRIKSVLKAYQDYYRQKEEYEQQSSECTE